MSKKADISYDEMINMKEKRRLSREKDKKSYGKETIGKNKSRHRNSKNKIYDDFDCDYDDLDY